MRTRIFRDDIYSDSMKSLSLHTLAPLWKPARGPYDLYDADASKFVNWADAQFTEASLHSFSGFAGFRSILTRNPNLDLSSSRSSAPIADYAEVSAINGQALQSDLLYRIAFARGERSPVINTVIDRMTEKTLSTLQHVDVRLPNKRGGFTHSRLKSADSVRDLLERRAMTSFTLMDIVELLDIASPIVPLKVATIEPDLEDKDSVTLHLWGVYDVSTHPMQELQCHLSVDIEEGQTNISYGNIYLPPELRHMCLGAQHLLVKALFARRHGIEEWETEINDDGIFVWPSIGAKVDPEDLNEVISTLRQLVEMGVLDDVPIKDTASIIDVANLRINKSSVKDEKALYRWLRDCACLSRVKAERVLQENDLPVGMSALKAKLIRANFDPEVIIDNILNEHFSSRIDTYVSRIKAREGNSFTDHEVASLNHRFVKSYTRGLIERELYKSIQHENSSYVLSGAMDPAFGCPAIYDSTTFWNAGLLLPTISSVAFVLPSVVPA
ncbi:MAG: hypothetical protein ABH871_06855 [Pseudomonadota bacterium]